MNNIKAFLVAHLILGPLAVYIIADDANHPERWNIWYRNPFIAVPYCVVLDAFISACCVYLWLQERRFKRRSKGMRLLQDALRLQAEGNYEAAEAAYQEGLKLMSMKQRR